VLRACGVLALALSAAVVLAPLADGASGPGVWTQSGPYGGTVNELAAAPGAPATMYAATGGGIFKSTNAGATWAGSSSGLTDGNVTSIAVNPANPSEVYATTTMALWRSTDAGATWATVPVSVNGVTPYNDTSLAFGAASKLYFSGSNGAVVSSDDGSTWTLLKSAGGVGAVIPDPLNASNVLVITSAGLQRSVDGGLTFTNCSVPAGLDVASATYDPGNDSIVFAGAGTLLRSTDGGASFQPVQTDAGSQVLQVAVSPSDPTHVYASGRLGQLTFIARSVDTGATWTTTTSVGGGDRTLLVDPTSSDHVYAGTNEGVFVSSDGTTTWAAGNNGLAAAAPNDLAVDPSSPTTAYAAMGPLGVYRTTDSGATWQQVDNDLGDPANPSAQITAVHVAVMANGTVFVARALSGPNAQPVSIFRSTDGGATWTVADSGLPAAGVWDVVAQPGSDTNAFVTINGDTGVSSAVYATTDGGSTWNPVGPAAAGIAALAIASDHTIVAATGGVYQNSPPQALFTSTNGGASWTALTAPPVQVSTFAFGATSATIYAGSAVTTQVAVSTNGGVSWTLHSVDPSNRSSQIDAIAVDPLDPAVVYAGTDAGGLWQSPDSGASWTALSTMGTRVASLTFSSSPGTPLLASLQRTTSSGLASFVSAPANLKLPTVTGTVTVGKTLSAKPGTWARGDTYAYQWLMAGFVIKGATKATYKLPSGTAKKQVSCRVTATGPGGVAAATSAAHTVSK
jgi:photosystem II stability/assembly factor-like uncharacterized protein